MKTSAKSDTFVRWWDLPAALILFAALLTAATRLNVTRWTQYLFLVQTITVLGTIAGLALGQSRFSPAVARFFAIAYGLFAIPWQLGLTLGQGILWQERLISMGNRLLITIDQIMRQKPVNDNLFFLFLMCTLFWSISVYAGYSLTRYDQPWKAILPAGLALVIIHAYDSFFAVRAWFLAAYIFFSLLLLARTNFLAQQRRWKQSGAYLPPFVGLDYIRLALIVTAVLVLFSWTAPAVASTISPAEQAWMRASAPWRSVKDRFSNAFASLQASVGVVSDFYGDVLPLGRGNPLTDTIVMSVQAPSRVSAGVRYYWRDRVFDHYDGAWSSTLTSDEKVSPSGIELNQPDYEGREKLTFTIKTYFPIQTLHTPSQPVWVSRPADAKVAVNPDGTIDLSRLSATPYIRAGEIYQVQASLVDATVAQLRAAGTDYPDWVKERYLQLPDNITPRTRALAKQVTAGLNNPYDKADAITNFLREHLKYSETVPTPPNGQEPVDWVLFDQQTAFCNYYATAEIVMLRSLGVPARMAVGYAEGERLSVEGADVVPTPGGPNAPQDISSQGDIFTVRHRDAHAWPEVYFPGIGWVEFEPTVSQAPIFRLTGEVIDPANQDSATNAAEQDARNRAQQLLNELADKRNQGAASALESRLHLPIGLWFLLGVLAIGLGVVFTNRTLKRRGSPPIPLQLEAGFRRFGIQPPQILSRWVYFTTMSPLAKAYLELNRALSRLGKQPQPADTPNERAKSLSQILPVASNAIEEVIGEYHTATYSNRNGNLEVARQAGIRIRNTSFLALIQRFLSRFQDPVKNRPFFKS